MEYYSAFAICPLFSVSDLKRQRAMLELMDICFETFPCNTSILSKGMVTKDVLLVAQGSAALMVSDCKGNRTPMKIVQRGETTGEALAASGQRNPMDIIARENDTVIARIPIREILQNEELERNFVSLLAFRTLDLLRRNAMLTQRSVRDKILFFLSQQKEAHHNATFLLPMSKKELAALLCVDPSALSRELAKLQREGIVEVHKNLYTLR